MNQASIYFLMFCAFLVVRDVFSHYLVRPGDGTAIAPEAMLVVYFWTAVALAWLFEWARGGGASIGKHWRRLARDQRLDFVKLGLATWAVYASTIVGFRLIGAPVFNVVEYSAMPLLTVLAGGFLLGERILAGRVVLSLVSVAGVVLIFLARPSGEGTGSWVWGLVCVTASAVLTSYCSAIQKRQVTDGLSPSVVLLFRFPLPALITTVWLLAAKTPIAPKVILPLMIIAAIGVFLPLLLLCFGFMRATLGEFSRYLFLIPILTWLLVPALVQKEQSFLFDWKSVLGASVLLTSFMLAARYESQLEGIGPGRPARK